MVATVPQEDGTDRRSDPMEMGAVDLPGDELCSALDVAMKPSSLWASCATTSRSCRERTPCTTTVLIVPTVLAVSSVSSVFASVVQHVGARQGRYGP